MKTSVLKYVGRTMLAAAAVAAVTVTAVADDRDGDRDGDRDRDRDERPSAAQVRRGFQIVPPGLRLSYPARDREMVGLGSYVVNTSGCIDCHSRPSYAPGGDPFRGEPEIVNVAQYLAGGRLFGPFKSANLTPDFAGRPAGLTLAEFLAVMRTGHDPKDPPGPPLQVMPWPVYGKKTALDLTAIYVYLRAIPPLPDNPNPGP